MAVSKYDSHVKPRLKEIEGWARNGLTDEEIARKLGIAASTFYLYKKEKPPLSEALKKNKEAADLQVEGALYRRAMGYSYNEDTFSADVDEDGTPVLKLVKRVTKEVQPDVTAQIFWLKNRVPERWRDKPREADTDEREHGVVELPAVPQKPGGADV